MAWQPHTLTREQMEERRLHGGRLLPAGNLSQAEIARELGVSRATVSAWKKQVDAGGLRRLRTRRSTGRPAKLTVAQRKTLVRLLKKGAQKAGFPTDRWTLARVQVLIRRELGVSYQVRYLGRVLRQLGWSPQVPLPRAVERDEDLIRAWLAQDWPRIKQSAAVRRRNRLFR